MRFYALRLQESGFVKASLQKIIAQGTDWRFLNELKKELKGVARGLADPIPPRSPLTVLVGACHGQGGVATTAPMRAATHVSW